MATGDHDQYYRIEIWQHYQWADHEPDIMFGVLAKSLQDAIAAAEAYTANPEETVRVTATVAPDVFINATGKPLAPAEKLLKSPNPG